MAVPQLGHKKLSSDYCANTEADNVDCLYNKNAQLLIGGVSDDDVPLYWPVPCPADECPEVECCNGTYIAPVPKEGSIVSLVVEAISSMGITGAVRWDKVVFSVHSQGSNVAAFAAIFLTAEHGSVAGLSLLSGPKGLQPGNDFPANGLLYSPEQHFKFPNGTPVTWSDLTVKALVASKYDPSYNDGNGEIAAAWNALGLNPPDDPFKITDNGGVVVTKESTRV